MRFRALAFAQRWQGPRREEADAARTNNVRGVEQFLAGMHAGPGPANSRIAQRQLGRFRRSVTRTQPGSTPRTRGT